MRGPGAATLRALQMFRTRARLGQDLRHERELPVSSPSRSKPGPISHLSLSARNPFPISHAALSLGLPFCRCPVRHIAHQRRLSVHSINFAKPRAFQLTLQRSTGLFDRL